MEIIISQKNYINIEININIPNIKNTIKKFRNH